eukprot:765399-Hanusia_phi.AAC.1
MCDERLVLLLALAAHMAVGAAQRPTGRFYPELAGLATPSVWFASSMCSTHSECGASQFCKWEFCKGGDNWFYVCGMCRPCSECKCNDNSFTGSCPPDKCPAEPTQEVRYLQGGFENMRLLPDNASFCYYRLELKGSQFTEQQQILPLFSSSSDASVQEQQDLQCPTLARSGVFEVQAGSSLSYIQFTILSGSICINTSFYPSSSFNLPSYPHLSYLILTSLTLSSPLLPYHHLSYLIITSLTLSSPLLPYPHLILS